MIQPINASPKTRKLNLAWIRLGMLAIVLSLIAWYITAHWKDFSDVLDRVSLPRIVAVWGMDVLFYAASAAIMFIVLIPFSIKLHWLEAFELGMVTRFGNLLLPLRGGAVARAVYLNKRFGFASSLFVASLSGMLLTSIITSLIWVLGGLLFLGLFEGKWFTEAMIIVAIGLGCLAGLSTIRFQFKNPNTKWKVALNHLAAGCAQFVKHKRAILQLMALYSLMILIQTGIYVILLGAMNESQPIHWGYLAVLVAMGNISMAFQLTPGNVGVYEALLAAIANLMGLDYNAILMAGLTWRVIDAVLVLVVGSLCSRQLARRLAEPTDVR
jgi:uncharacterized membrane protein YbhN (UPF0104 family)